MLKIKSFQSISKCRCCELTKPATDFGLKEYKSINPRKQICIKCELKRFKSYNLKKGVDVLKDKKPCKTCKKNKLICHFKFEEHGGFISECNKCYYSNKKQYGKKYYVKNKKTILKKQKTNNDYRQRKAGTIDLAYQSLLDHAYRDGKKCLITKEELFDRLTKQKTCEYSGKPLIAGKNRYSLDRIGLKQYGGNGKKGGDYCWGNVRIVLFEYNKAREVMQLTDKQMIKLCADMRKNPGKYK